MGEYNPSAGLIVGQEWVPILNEPYILTPAEEIGWTFDMPSSEVVSKGTAYISENVVDAHVGGLNHSIAPLDLLYLMMQIYPEGTESDTGPMKQSIVECSGATTSGTPSGFLTSAPSLRDALYRPSDHYAAFASVAATSKLFMNFDFNSHTELIGKRIVKLEFLYTIDTDSSFNATSNLAAVFQDVGSPPATSLNTSVPLITTADLLSQSGFNFDTIPAATIPNINIIVDGTIPTTFSSFPVPSPTDCYPWTYDRLQLFDIGAGVRQQTLELRVIQQVTNTFDIRYAAMRVTYCEERRVAFGGQCIQINPNSTSKFGIRPLSLIPDAALLPAGRYTLTIEGGKLDTEVFAAREIRQLPGQAGLVINRTERVAETFTDEPTDQLVMMQIHRVNGDTILGPHGYGPQVQADTHVWPDTLETRQGIINNSQDGTLDYPVARFYARRFGETNAPLVLTSDSVPATTQEITVEEFDALPEITDGWKEVNLRFDPPYPVFDDSGSIATYYWRSNTDIGAPWQVMGASSFARTGDIPYVPILGADAPLRNNYGADMAYMTIDGIAQVSMDATLVFAQEMPAVSGLVVLGQTLAVTGIGLECGIPPDCIPTGISYHGITWDALSAASVPASGFGYYELQRSDTIDTTWNTILQASSPLVTGFSDFEARVGIESRYRIRFQHKLLFPSAWSPEVTGTIPAPGVTGAGAGNGVLVFTTNERQTGNSSLAYAMVWGSGSVAEGFTFVEAGDVVLQQMYDRDYQVAFRPLERGGERFNRTMLVQAAAVPDGLIQHGFTSLRDLAWEDVSYVCVRDELGDRWLATVIVPDGVVQRDRRLYMAQVDVIEVTATPSIVTLPSAVQGPGPGGGAGAGCIPALWDGIPGWDYGCWSD